jgi:superfamily II DNA or RNA helicase
MEQKKNDIQRKIDGVSEQIKLLNQLKGKLEVDLKAIDNVPVLSDSEKINIFKSLFIGRNDVYSKLWISKKTGKKGYSPACKNEWTKNICIKPTGKCSDCTAKEYLPFTNEVILGHLNGMQVIGIYPMLTNERCRFLAADFDKESWFDDVSAFRSACIEAGVPAYVERSRSGNGAHVWVFFSEEVPAYLARKLGTYLITLTMSGRYQLDMKSYDRLFPNQDYMPQGGFGNLIAMPMQKEAALSGNTLFLDENMEPYIDQWGVLKNARKLSIQDVSFVLSKAGVSTVPVLLARDNPVDENDKPWMIMPSGKSTYKPQFENLPKEIEVVLANKIYLSVKDMPSALLNRIRNLAAFQNPEFYRKQKMRFSTYATPRIVDCSEIDKGYLILPRGCMEELKLLLAEYAIAMTVKDERITGKEIKAKFSGKLNAAQKEAVKDILEHETGVLSAPPGFGKTVLAAYVIAQRKKNVLILTHRKPLLEQWIAQLCVFLGRNKKEIGKIGGGKRKPTGNIDVAMVQSLEDGGKVDDLVAGYGFIIADECHHVSAYTFEKIMSSARAAFVLGLTATPYRKDGHQPIIHMQCGPIVHEIKQKDMASSINEYKVIMRNTDFVYEDSEKAAIQEIMSALVASESRNTMLVSDIENVANQGRFPMVLTERKEHLAYLEKHLTGKVKTVVPLFGGMGKKKIKASMDMLAASQPGDSRVIIATGSYVGEGFDLPGLDTIFLTTPLSYKGRLVQYAGRIQREYEGKDEVRIYDYLDINIPVLKKMYAKRLKTYKILGYTVS